MVYGTVNGRDRTGGIVGTIGTHGRVTDCFSLATVTGTTNVGGIAGYLGANNHAGSVSDIYFSYATGAITGTSAVGGIAGRTEELAYATTNVALNASVNGQQAGAVIGVNGSNGGGNLVLRGLLVNGVAVTSNVVNNNGIGFRVRTLAELRQQNTYRYVFGNYNTSTYIWQFGTTEARPWVMGNTPSWNLPFLYFQTSPPANQQLPVHLR